MVDICYNLTSILKSANKSADYKMSVYHTENKTKTSNLSNIGCSKNSKWTGHTNFVFEAYLFSCNYMQAVSKVIFFCLLE